MAKAALSRALVTLDCRIQICTGRESSIGSSSRHGAVRPIRQPTAVNLCNASDDAVMVEWESGGSNE